MPPFFEQGLKLGGRERLAEKVPLHLVAMERFQELELAPGLNAFREHREV